MNTDHFRYILSIAQCQSISQAAENLHLQRPYLSKILLNLEQELNVTIFIRTPKGILITPEGEQILEKMQQVIDILDTMKCHNQNTVPIAYAEYFDEITLISPKKIRPRKHSAQYLPSFQKLFPNVTVSMIEEDIHHIMAAVENYPLSFAFTLRTENSEALNQPVPDTLIYQPFTKNPLVALASPNNVVAQKYQTMTLATLTKQPLVLFDFLTQEDSYIFSLLQSHIHLNIRYTVSSMPLFYQLLENNPFFSIGIFSEDINDHLLQIPLRDDIYIEQGILYRKDCLDNIVGKKFLELLLTSYGKSESAMSS